MSEGLLYLIGFFVLFYVLNKWVFPKLGLGC